MSAINLSGNPEVSYDTNILDLTIPKEMEQNLSTGIPHLDVLFAGDGICPSSVVLLTGIPGAGKSTIGMQLCDSLTGLGVCAVFNTNEESLIQVRRTTKRLNLKNGFIPAYKSEAHELVNYLEGLQKVRPGKRIVCVVDSIQTLEYKDPERVGPGRPLGKDSASVESAYVLAAWAKKTYNVVILIGQVNKKGEFAGKQELKHAIDCACHLSIDTDRKSETYGQRMMSSLKNRFAPSGIEFVYALTSTGLVFGEGQLP